MNWNKIFQGNVGYKFWFQRQNFILGQPVNLVTHAPTVKIIYVYPQDFENL